MSEKWTPEPWGINKYGCIGAGRHFINPVIAKSAWLDVPADEPANLERIVACVNACKGIDNPPEGLVGDLVEALDEIKETAWRALTVQGISEISENGQKYGYGKISTLVDAALAKTGRKP